MKAIVATRIGGPEVLELQEVPDPQTNQDEILVRVEAAGVNFADAMQTRGAYPGGPHPPFVPGLEFAGVIEGTDERVMGFSAGGAYAERIAVPRGSAMPYPAAWSAAEAAAFLVNYLTAYFAYWMANVTPGERVLIHAAAGGVGTAAVQLADAFGVETYGTASSNEKLENLKKLGLDHPINYKERDYEQAVRELTNGEGVDVVFEMLGGEHTAKNTRLLRDLGRVIVYGMATGQPPQFDFMAMFQRNASVHALWLMPLARDVDKMQQAFDDLLAWAEAGRFRPIVGHTLPLAQAAEAHRMLLERRNYGKVVLTPRD